MFVLTSLVFSGLPDLCAYIQLLLLCVKSIVPPLQLLQFPHLTLAVILPLLIPLPSSSDISAALSYNGITCPTPSLGDMVTFEPSAEVYMTKMFEFAMPEPWPSATHE